MNKSLYTVIEDDLILDLSISDKAYRVYGLISLYSNNTHGYCYLKYKQLYEMLKLSKRQFIRCVNELIAKNYLFKIKIGTRTYLMPVVNRAIKRRGLYSTEKSFANYDLLDYDWLSEKE